MSVIRVSSPASATVYKSFTADILIDAPQNLGGFEFDLVFNPAILQVQRAILGDLLGRTGRTAEPLGPMISNTAGTIAFGGYTYGTQAGATSGGVLGRITFLATAVGHSTLNIQDAILADIKGNPAQATYQGAMVEVRPASTPRYRVHLPLIRK